MGSKGSLGLFQEILKKKPKLDMGIRSHHSKKFLEITLWTTRTVSEEIRKPKKKKTIIDS